MSSEKPEQQKSEDEKPSVTLPGTVEKIIPAVYPSESDKAQIAIDGADHLYREIRVPNTLQDESGNEVALKPGADVDVTIEADASATMPTRPSKPTASGDSVQSVRDERSGKPNSG
jgi:hypothetical protein